MAKTQVCKKSVSVENGTVAFAFQDGGDAVVVSLNDFTPEMLRHFTLHGISQKLGDSFSGADGNAAAARASFNTVLTGTKGGDWSTRGEAGPRITVLAEAVANLQGIEIADAVEFLSGLDKDGTKLLRANAQVKAEVARITAQRAAEKAAKAATAAASDEDGFDMDAFRTATETEE